MVAPAFKLKDLALVVLSITMILTLPNSQTPTTAQEVDSQFPLFSPAVFVYGQRTPLEVFEGDNLELVVVLRNENKVSANITLITQIVDQSGVVSAIQESNSTISSSNETVRLANNWKTESEGIHHVEVFVMGEVNVKSNLSTFYPLSEKWTTDIPVRSNEHANTHNFQIEMRIYNPENIIAGSTLKGSVELVNYSNDSEFIKIQPDGSIDFLPEGMVGHPQIVSHECDFWSGGKLDDIDAIELPAHGKVTLNEGDKIEIPYSLDHEDNYDLRWYANLLVQEPDGVNCIYVASNVVSFHVSAPAYEKVDLILSTDKQTYNRNETIRFEALIENSSDDPFELAAEEIEIHILNSEGQRLLVFSSVAADQPPKIVSPHSNYTLQYFTYPDDALWFWEWDQRNYTPEGIPFAVEPGEYHVYATFSSPPMRSKTITIAIHQ